MEEETIELKELLELLRANIRKIGIITLICVIFAGIYLFFATPIYQSEAVLMIRQPQDIGGSILKDGDYAGVARMNEYEEILKSKSIRSFAEKANGAENKDGDISTKKGYLVDVNTVLSKNSGILKLIVKASTPEKAKLVSEKLIESFRLKLSDLARIEKGTTKILIEDGLKVAEKEMLANKGQLLKYKEKEHILTYYPQGGFLNQGNDSGNDSGNEIAAIAVLGQRLEFVDREIAKTKLEIATSEAKIEALKKHLGNDENISASNADIESAKARLMALDKLSKENDQKIEKLAKIEQEYLQVLRKSKVSEELYIMLANRLGEAKVAEVMTTSDVQVIDSPTLATAPIKPRKALTLVLAMVLGLVISSGYIILVEFMSDKKEL